MDTNIVNRWTREATDCKREKRWASECCIIIFCGVFLRQPRPLLYHELRRCISTTRGLVNSCPTFVLIIWAGDLHEPSSSDLHAESTFYHHYHPSQLQDDEDRNYPEPEVRSRLPSIFLAQQQPGFDNEAYLSVENSPGVVSHNRLSTITEHTERTEPSLMWRSRQQYLVPNNARSFQSSPTTSYGLELGVSKLLYSQVIIHFFVR